MESPHKDSEPDTHTVTQCACVCVSIWDIHETQSSKASVSVQFTKSVEINPIPVEISLQVGRVSFHLAYKYNLITFSAKLMCTNN